MYYEGVQRLLASGVTIAGLHAGDPSRVALEAYPRRLAHALVEWRSYKNQDLPDRGAAREAILRALESQRARARSRSRSRSTTRCCVHRW
jgi:hypothetical protein